MKFKNALVSVSDKTGLVEFIKPLADSGMRVVSTGGTAQVLRQAGVNVVDISEQTHFPEVMGGRVKTLHPRVHMALLARQDNKEDLELLKTEGLEPFDLVVVNLYPFEEALAGNHSENQQVEYIDIGGPTLLRAAAKNHSYTTVVCEPDDYQSLLEKTDMGLEDRRYLAAKVFAHVSAYDAMIAGHLGMNFEFKSFSLGGQFVRELRYGENPQQQAAWYRRRGAKGGVHEAEILQGKALSYNNLLDIQAAAQTLREFEQPACVAVKHNNPCGVAVADKVAHASRLAFAADPVSVFGGIVAINRELDAETAQFMSETFLECIVAPQVSSAAIEVLKKKKNLRVLEWSSLHTWTDVKSMELRSLDGGFLLQTRDRVSAWSPDWKVVSGKPVESSVREDLAFAWRVCAHLKSNAIAIVARGQTLGLGMGQVNRVDAVEQALARLHKFHGDKLLSDTLLNPVLASDAFFPFPDSVELAAKAGVQWIVQPGGSMRDAEVLAKAKECGVEMVFTGMRHFQH